MPLVLLLSLTSTNRVDQMCMNEDIDALPGLYGYHVTGSLPLRPGATSRQQEEWRAVAEAPAWVEADVERCRSADEAFAAAIAAESAEGERKEQEIAENGDGDDIAISDSLYGTDEDIDGVPMSPGAQEQPREGTHAQQSWPEQGLAPSAEMDSGKTGSFGMLEKHAKEKGVEGGIGSLSTDSARKIGAVLAQGDRVMRAVADAVAAAKAGGAGASCTDEGGNGEGREFPKIGGKEDGNEDGKSKERTLAKALAKERGRERGKQREKERVAELEAAKKREEMVKERRRREREEMDRIRAERQEERLLEKAGRKLDASKRARLTNLRESKPERYASLAARQRRRSRSVTSRSDSSSSSDSSETSSPNRSSSGVEKGVSPRGLDRSSGGGGGGGRERGRAAEKGGDSRSHGFRRSRSIEGRRGSKKRDSRSRSHSRSGWRNRGRNSYYNNSSDGGRTRGGNRNDRSPSPPSDARSGRGNEGTNKQAEGEKEKEEEREPPSSTVWSEWRSVSSERSSNDDSVSEKAQRSVIRSVTASGAGVDGGGSSGLVIRLKRGSSLVRPPAVAASATSSAATAATEAVAMRKDGTGDGGAGSSRGSRKTQLQKEGGSRSRGSGKRSDNDEDDVHRLTRGENPAFSSRSRTGERGSGREDSHGAPSRSDGRARARSPRRGGGGDDSSSRRSGRRSSSRDRSRGRRGEFLPSSRMDSTGGGGGKAREYHRPPAYRSRSRSGELRRQPRRSRSRSRSIGRRSQSRHRHSYRRNGSRSQESRVGRPSSYDGKTSGNDSAVTESEEGEVLPRSRGVKSTALCATGNKNDSSRITSTSEMHPDLLVKSALVDKREKEDVGSGKGTPDDGAAVTWKAIAGDAKEGSSKYASSTSQVEVAEKGEVGNQSSINCEGVVEGERAATGSVSLEAEASGTVPGETYGSGSRETTGGVHCRVITGGGAEGPGDATTDELANRENLVGTSVAESEVKDAVNDKSSVTISTVGESMPKFVSPPAAASTNRAPVLSQSGQATTIQEKQKRKRWDVVGPSPSGQSARVGEAVVLDSHEMTGADVIGPGDRVGELAGTESLNLEPREVERGEGGGFKQGGNGAVIPVGRSATEAPCGDCNSGDVKGSGDRADELAGAESLDPGPGEVRCGDGGEIKFKDEDDAAASSVEGAVSEVTPSPAAAANARSIAPLKDGQVVPARRKKTGRWGVAGSPRGQGNATVEALTVRAVAPGLQENTGCVLDGGHDSGSVESPGKKMALGPGEAWRGDGGEIQREDKGDGEAYTMGGSASEVTPSPTAAAADARATVPSKGGPATLDRQKNIGWWGVVASPKGQGDMDVEVSTARAVASKTGAAGSQHNLGTVLGGGCDRSSVEGPGGLASECLGHERVDLALGDLLGGGGVDVKGKDRWVAPLTGWSSPAFTFSPAATPAPAQATAPSRDGHASSVRKQQGQGKWWMPGHAASPPESQGAATFEGVPFGALTLGALTPAAITSCHGSRQMTSDVLERVDGSGGVEGSDCGAGELAGLESVVEEPGEIVRRAEGEGKVKGKSFRVEPVADRSAPDATPPPSFTTAAVKRANVPLRGGQANPTQKLHRRARRGKWARSASLQTGQGGPRGKKSNMAADPSGHEQDVPHPPRQEGESATSAGGCSVIPQASDAPVSGLSLPPQQGRGSSGSVDVVDASNSNEETASEEGLVDVTDHKASSGSWWRSGSAVHRHLPAVRRKNWFRKQRKKRTKLLQDVRDKKDPQGKVD